MNSGAIYKRTNSGAGSSENEIAPGDLKQSVCLAVEAEIQVEVSEYELTDDEYLDVADRCWSKFYSCCVQYLQTGTAALGMFWLPATNCMAVVKKTGFSLLRQMDTLEALYLKQNNDTSETCGYLMKALKELEDTPEISTRFEAALDSKNSIEKVALNEIESVSSLEEDLKNLIDMLQLAINDCEKGDCDENIFTSDLGVSAVITTLQQLTDIRFDLCKKLVLLIEVSSSDELKARWAETVVDLCKRFWTLKWVCQAQFSPGEGNINMLFNSHTPALFLHRFLITHQLLTYSDLLSSAAAVSEAVWLESTCKVVAEFLLNTQQYLLLQQLAHHVPHSSWNLILAQAFLEMGEPHKAYDLAANETEDYFKVIQMFERHDLPHYVIDLAKNATETIEVDPDSPDLATLHSVLFLHHLKLGHWESAYHSMETNPEVTRRVDCLGQLITELVSTRNIKTLLEFPYCAARVMYEHGLRSENTRAQCQCYGACLNALQLVSSENAWIVKPSSDREDEIEVLELKDIRREYELSKARCLLKDCSPDSLPAEVVLRCVSEGFYKMALQLCHLFRLGYEQPLEALATACITIANHDKPWDWLLQNEISDLVVGDASAGAVAWRLLEHLLFQYEEEGLTTLHQVVASKIMSHSAFLPHWLEASYKKRNPGELIRLYMRYGNLQEAIALSELLLKATLGVGKEHFNLKNSLLSTAPGLWLPLNTIDCLISELHHQPSMSNEAKDLTKATDKFLETASRISKDKIAAVYTH
ncbi:hypothetical protein LSTR_LSTR002134 [Laodelphax striatellus]|uniref:Uncharacterized protein n=1 Tax=Laodelphax striatellus TaxID=195883 RepID=A0A482XRJ0_LAOST|nr:hypothetical protein LSTR_LSTR002134 [Laodelphax striatellus]